MSRMTVECLAVLETSIAATDIRIAWVFAEWGSAAYGPSQARAALCKGSLLGTPKNPFIRSEFSRRLL